MPENPPEYKENVQRCGSCTNFMECNKNSYDPENDRTPGLNLESNVCVFPEIIIEAKDGDGNVDFCEFKLRFEKTEFPVIASTYPNNDIKLGYVIEGEKLFIRDMVTGRKIHALLDFSVHMPFQKHNTIRIEVKAHDSEGKYIDNSGY